MSVGPWNDEYVKRVESERGTRRLIREREERDRAARAEMDRKHAICGPRPGTTQSRRRPGPSSKSRRSQRPNGNAMSSIDC